ncbi:MAG: hypothetical protein ACYTGH_17635 [Planctomycetota bacterium]|jgi:hypothetical protein
MASKEPLYQIFTQHRVACDDLFGLAVCARVLESLIEDQSKKRELYKRKLDHLKSQNSGGLLGRFKKQGEDEQGEGHDLAAAVGGCDMVLSLMHRELNSLEKPMVEAFWLVYEHAACLLVEDLLNDDNEAVVRAFLRYGMLGISSHFLPTDTVRHILRECREPVREFGLGMEDNHVLYADEYIDLVSRYKMPPSIDEELELNMTNSPEWKADKALRKLINTQLRGTVLKELGTELATRALDYRKRQKEAEIAKARVSRSDKDYKKLLSEYGYEAQKYRVEAARLERALERIKEKYLPRQAEISQESHVKLEETGKAPGRKCLALREARAIRKICKLCARLKEPFLPFTLRDNFKLSKDQVNSRADFLARLKVAEERDPTIFKEELMPVKKASQRIYQRFAPVFLLAPACHDSLELPKAEEGNTREGRDLHGGERSPQLAAPLCSLPGER